MYAAALIPPSSKNYTSIEGFIQLGTNLTKEESQELAGAL